MRLIGPNRLGIMMPGVSLNASFAAHMPGAGNLALISQSGAIAAGMVDWAAQRGVGLSGIVTIGDQIDVDIADLLDHFTMDPQDPRDPALHRSHQGRAQVHVGGTGRGAREAGRRGQKSGRMAQGAKAAATHTGALADADAVYTPHPPCGRPARSPICASCSIAPRRSVAMNHRQEKASRHPHQWRGIGVLAVDQLVDLGGIPASISAETRKRLDAVLPPTWSGANPVDIVGDADASRYAAATGGAARRS